MKNIAGPDLVGEIPHNHTTDIKSDGGYPLITIGRFCIMSFLSNESPKKIFGGFQILISWAQLPYKLTKLNRTNQDHMFYILQIETFHLVWTFGRGYRLYFHQNLNQFILIFVNFVFTLCLQRKFHINEHSGNDLIVEIVSINSLQKPQRLDRIFFVTSIYGSVSC